MQVGQVFCCQAGIAVEGACKPKPSQRVQAQQSARHRLLTSGPSAHLVQGGRSGADQHVVKEESGLQGKVLQCNTRSNVACIISAEVQASAHK